MQFSSGSSGAQKQRTFLQQNHNQIDRRTPPTGKAAEEEGGEYVLLWDESGEPSDYGRYPPEAWSRPAEDKDAMHSRK